MNLFHSVRYASAQQATRRYFLKQSLGGLAAAFCGLAAPAAQASRGGIAFDPKRPWAPRPPHFAPKARRIIYLHMDGAPSQLELFERKPELNALHGQVRAHLAQRFAIELRS